MVKTKSSRAKGKIQLSKYFQKLDDGDAVAVIKENSMQPAFPSRLQGRTGIVEGMQGRSAIVRIKQNNNEKKFLIEPIHLKKIKQIKKQ